MRGRLVACLMVLFVVWAVSGVAYAAPIWTIQSTPNVAGVPVNVLNGVSCATPNRCTAVGYYTTTDDPFSSEPIAERWNGSRWELQTVPNPPGATLGRLAGVSCPTPNACMAVGQIFKPPSMVTVMAAARWDGVRWTALPMPASTRLDGSGLHSVSCATPRDCVAVGGAPLGSISGTLVLHWNGTAWQMVSSPNPADSTGNELWGVSCTNVRDCTAVGIYSTSPVFENSFALAEHWNGATWQVEPTPDTGTNDSMLNSVSCATARNCTAVGTAFNASLAEHWNGSVWQIEPTPTPAGALSLDLNGVSCAPSRGCVAVGNYVLPGPEVASLAEHRDQSGWQIESTPTIGLGQSLAAVSCTTGCTAVGQFQTGMFGPLFTLAERRQGTP